MHVYNQKEKSRTGSCRHEGFKKEPAPWRVWRFSSYLLSISHHATWTDMVRRTPTSYEPCTSHPKDSALQTCSKIDPTLEVNSIALGADAIFAKAGECKFSQRPVGSRTETESHRLSYLARSSGSAAQLNFAEQSGKKKWSWGQAMR